MKTIPLAGTLTMLADITQMLEAQDWCGHVLCAVDALDPEGEGCYFSLHPEPFFEHREGAPLGTIY